MDAPSDGADERSDETAEAREPFPEAKDEEWILGDFARIVEDRIEHVGEDEARDRNPPREGEHGAVARAEAPGLPERGDRTGVGTERDEHSEGFQRNGHLGKTPEGPSGQDRKLRKLEIRNERRQGGPYGTVLFGAFAGGVTLGV